MKKMVFKSVIPETVEDEEVLKAKHDLWRMGDLSWKLLGVQRKIYEEIIDQTRDTSVILCGRRTGKSFANKIASLEVCIQNPGTIVKYACPTKKMVEEMMVPNLEYIFRDAPPEFNLKSMWDGAKGILRFPNGSRLYIAGTDNGNAENLRGAFAHLVFCDEAGFMDELSYVVDSILLPQTDTTGGKLILSSTPNFFNPLHEFHTDYVFPAEANKTLIKFTLWDSPTTTYEDKLRIVARYKGGENNPKFKCEYTCEIPKTSETNVFPEFSEHKEDVVVSEMELPPYVHCYVSGDIGVRDLTVYLFGFYDFKNATLNIIDEWVASGDEVTSKRIANGVKEKEKEWFKEEDGSERIPFRRVMDNDLKLINDLRQDYGLSFMATDKKNKMGAISTFRTMIEEGRIKIHERCKHTIYHLEYARWHKSKSRKNEFDHLEDMEITDENGNIEIIKGGHCDGADAAIYMQRNVNEKINPYPQGFQTIGENQFQSTWGKEQQSDNKITMLKRMLGIRKR